MNYLTALASGDGDGRRPVLTRTEEWREDEQLDDLIPAHGPLYDRWPSMTYRHRITPQLRPRPQFYGTAPTITREAVVLYLIGDLLGPYLLRVMVELSG